MASNDETYSHCLKPTSVGCWTHYKKSDLMRYASPTPPKSMTPTNLIIAWNLLYGSCSRTLEIFSVGVKCRWHCHGCIGNTPTCKCSKGIFKCKHALVLRYSLDLLLWWIQIFAVLSETYLEETYISPWRTEIVTHVPVLYPEYLNIQELT